MAEIEPAIITEVTVEDDEQPEAREEEPVVPVCTTLKEVYGEGAAADVAQARIEQLVSKFKEIFGKNPQAIARAPGQQSAGSMYLCLFFYVFYVFLPNGNNCNKQKKSDIWYNHQPSQKNGRQRNELCYQEPPSIRGIHI